MYGMVNKALEDMIVSRRGEDIWEQIKEAAEVDIDIFVSNEGYSDEVTYSLVGAASAILDEPVPDILEAFGIHWIIKTAREGYGDLMEASGKNLRDFLLNLPNFHTRVELIFPHLNPPGFACTDIDSCGLRLHYISQRSGLTPFVVGLLKGLGIMFATPVRVQLLQSREAGADHDVFQVEWDGPETA